MAAARAAGILSYVIDKKAAGKVKWKYTICTGFETTVEAYASMNEMTSLAWAVVYGFHIYQDMAALQEERAEKIVLENQISQMQSSMVEMEHLYDGIRSVKHDMKNHMAVLQNLIQKRYSGRDEEIRQYFEGMRQSVEQIRQQGAYGNAVSDAVVGSKFRYAAKKVKGIRLDASKFMLTDAVTIKAYDMGIILNNGLDNAVEACMQMREKQPDAETLLRSGLSVQRICIL